MIKLRASDLGDKYFTSQATAPAQHPIFQSFNDEILRKDHGSLLLWRGRGLIRPNYHLFIFSLFYNLRIAFLHIYFGQIYLSSSSFLLSPTFPLYRFH